MCFGSERFEVDVPPQCNTHICQERLCMTGPVMCVAVSSAESTFAIKQTIRQMLNDPVGTQTPHEGVNATNPRS